MMRITASLAEKRDSGAAAVELALVLPLLVVLMFGMVEFGLAFNTKITLTHAAREGARLAAVGQYNQQAVEQMVPAMPGVSAVSASIEATTSSALGKAWMVTVRCRYSLVEWEVKEGAPKQTLIPTFVMSSSATMRAE